MTKKKKHKCCPNHVQTNLTYTKEEIMKKFDKHSRTIDNWVNKEFLRAIDSKRPRLFHGTDLRRCFELLEAHRSEPRCQEHEMRCPSCKVPRIPKEGTITPILNGTKKPQIKAACSVCGSSMVQFSSSASIDKKMSMLVNASQRVLKLYCGYTREASPRAALEPDWVCQYHAPNERIKRAYFDYQREVCGHASRSVPTVAFYLVMFERFHGFIDFKEIRLEQIRSYMKMLRESDFQLHTKQTAIAKIRAFLTWLSCQRRYQKAIKPDILQYLRLTKQELRAVNHAKTLDYPTYEEAETALREMPENTHLELRNKAMMALLLPTGMRDGTIPQLKIRHLHLSERMIRINALEIETKNGVSYDCVFLPRSDLSVEILTRYVDELTKKHGFEGNAPLFPKLTLKVGKDREFEMGEFSDEHLADEQIIRIVCKKAFNQVGLPAHSPRKLRHTIAREIKRLATNEEEKEALALNFGHLSFRYIARTYGQMDTDRQHEIMHQLIRQNALPQTDPMVQNHVRP